MSEKMSSQEAEPTAPLSSLDIDEGAMRALSESATALVADYFRNITGLEVFPRRDSLERLEEIIEAGLEDEGQAVERIVEDFRLLLAASRHNGHPRFFGYIASPSTPVGAYADLLASALNPNVTSWRSAPAATEVERTVVGWLAEIVGYGSDSSGLLTSGGSMANLTALLMAHRARSPQTVSLKGLRDVDAPMTVYASEQVHLSIPKAADVLGLGREQVRMVEIDDEFRLDVKRLREKIDADLRAGFKPFCVVANAGTVNTGAVDPIEEIARVAEEYGLWLHVDGAYGAPATLDQEKRAIFRGIERADSLSMDAHKWLYAPVDCGCLLFRDAAAARRALSPGEADYIKVHESEEREAFAFWDYGIELSRRFRALKLWMMLRYYGRRRLAEAIAHDNRLADYLAERVSASEDFQLLAPVSLSICCFRYVPARLRLKLEGARNEGEREAMERELDELNARIMHVVQRGGRAYVSNATLRGRFALRACIINFRTTRADMDDTLDIIRDAARDLDTE
ncbi:MAG TPA: aminotransferase class V-fold PLP-dependent enzyme [Pyrinomonadaceae bacterium]|nr:aminotransferase class V-fold PLP-dependent enzyme [Pyrinomonadaceae bacterium]